MANHGSRRGERRRAALLEAVVADLKAGGLVDWSLRRAARAANTTHKVLLYHFGGADELLREALDVIRDQRIRAATLRPDEVALGGGDVNAATLSEAVVWVWDELRSADPAMRVLDQATALALYDTKRHRDLGVASTEQYLPHLMALCPTEWRERQRIATATLLLAAIRGLHADATLHLGSDLGRDTDNGHQPATTATASDLEPDSDPDGDGGLTFSRIDDALGLLVQLLREPKQPTPPA